MYLYGASGHAKVIIEILECLKITVDGLFDDNANIKKLLNYPVKPYEHEVISSLIISIGNNAIREKIADHLNVQYGRAFHPTSSISKRSVIGEGTVVMSGVSINADAQIGKHCIVNTNASIDHDCILGDFVHVSPNAALCGDVHIGEGSHIGAGAVIIPGIRIGKWCNVGAGAVIIRNIPDYSKVVGNPGSQIQR